VDRAANTNALLPGDGLFNPVNRAANTNAPAVHGSIFGSTVTLAPGFHRLPCYHNIIVFNRGNVVYAYI
jgi:hypothetical protein